MVLMLLNVTSCWCTIINSAHLVLLDLYFGCSFLLEVMLRMNSFGLWFFIWSKFCFRLINKGRILMIQRKYTYKVLNICFGLCLFLSTLTVSQSF